MTLVARLRSGDEMDNDVEIEFLRFQVENLTKGINMICNELVQAGMSEYNPPHVEMIAMGQWGLGLPDALGVGDGNSSQ